MKIKILFSLPLLLFFGFGCTSMNQSTQFERFFAWNLPADQASLQQAAALGVTDGTVVVSNLDQIRNARQCGIRPYSYLLPIESLWDEYGDGGPAPLQVMSQEENDCFNLLHHSDAGQKIRAERHHQFGGEPPREADGTFRTDVLDLPILCLGNPRTLAAVKKRIAADAQIEELGGICFDYVGFQNYHDCLCDGCTEAFNTYLQETGQQCNAVSRNAFFRQQLVSFNNELHAYAKELRPDWETAAHLYPVFTPDPLYGKDLLLDHVGETAAWFFPWPQEKIRQYSKQIGSYPRGVPFIGYYDATKRPEFPQKTAETVERELTEMSHSGAKMVMVYDFADVLADPQVREIFARHIKRK